MSHSINQAGEDNNSNDNQDTGDFSSYWQSIPDPPTFAGTASSSSAATKKSKSNFVVSNNGHHLAIANSQVSNSGIRKKRLRDVTNEKRQTSSSLKKKNRRSFLLPSDDIISSTGSNADSKPLSSSAANCQNNNVLATFIPETKSSSSRIESDNEKHSHQRLIQLVREYCALPDDQRRSSSREAYEIQRLSCYPMPGKKFHIPTKKVINDDDKNDDEIEGDDNSKPDTTKLTMKQQMIHHLKPIVEEMEHRKQTDLMESRYATQCEMYKKKGRCHYFNVDTGVEVDPREYERRYLGWLDGKRDERLDCLRRRSMVDYSIQDSVDESGNGRNDDKPSPQLDGVDEEEASQSEFSLDMDQSVSMDDSMMSLIDSPSDDTEMDTKDETASSLEAVIASATDTTTFATMAMSNSRSVSSAEAVNNISGSNSDDASIRGLAQPPIRMSLSTDTRVLEARARLFRAIDIALANYSREMLGIQQEEQLLP